MIRAMTPSSRSVATIGAGYVGLVTAVGLAKLGHTIQLIESRADRRAALAAGRVPLHEEGLQQAFTDGVEANRIRVADRVTQPVDAILVCVGTPVGSDGRSDLSQVRSALADLAEPLSIGVPLVIRSTLPPGGTRLVVEWSGLPPGQVLTNPEFLRQGTALADFLQPSRIIIGRFAEADPVTVASVLGLFDGIDAPRLVVDVGAAELIKNASNAFLALKLSFANELAGLSEEYGVDIDEVLSGLKLDPRIGGTYLRPSFGFGGSCLPKETKALAAAGTARGLPMHITTAGSLANAASQERFAIRIATALGGLEGRTVALLGLAFKAGTDDVRSSPALILAARLMASGARVVAFDPQAAANARADLPELELAATAAVALAGADAAVIGTEWPEFAALDWQELGSTMRRRLIVDGRRLLNGAELRDIGFEFIAFGSPEVRAATPVAAGERVPS